MRKVDSMNKMENSELISALADGQLHGEEFARGVQAATADAAALRTWQAYHLVGDVLRSRELAATASPDQFLERLRARLLAEQAPRPPAAVAAATATAQPGRPAANDASLRWKLVAGFATVAAMAAIGWTVAGSGLSGNVQPQLASAPGAAAGAALVAGNEQGAMIRDPKLDQFLAAHRQFGSANALQAPAGFLRNATFEGPAR
jgi:sigma-E factor negative regulatory protein RseA